MDGRPPASARAVVLAGQLARDEADQWGASSPEATYCRRVARGLCRKDGRDPDAITMGIAGVPVTVDAKGCAALVGPIHPNWWHYVGEARFLIQFARDGEACLPPETDA